MLDLDELFDYIQDDVRITFYDLDAEKDIEVDLSLDEAKEWAENHSCELCTIEPSMHEAPNDFGITVNICNVEELD